MHGIRELARNTQTARSCWTRSPRARRQGAGPQEFFGEPPAAITRSDALRSHLVRLECPSELDEGDWDGPIYARLQEPRYITKDHRSVFVVDDSSRTPGWLCQLIFYSADFDSDLSRLGEAATLATTPVVIPYSRLTRPSEALSSETQDRPLLLLFRFLRFSTCYLSCGTRTYREVQLDVFLTGQVVAYLPTRGATFLAATGASLQPSYGYICIVALRGHVGLPPTRVAIACNTAWTQRISRDEFVAGWCHGVSATAQPSRRLSRFRSRWAELIIPDGPDDEVKRVLDETFVPTGSDSTIDFCREELCMVSEYGRVVHISPLGYARKYIGPARAATRMDEDIEVDQEAPSESLAIGMSRGRPLPSHVPAVASHATCRDFAAFMWRVAPSVATGANIAAAVATVTNETAPRASPEAAPLPDPDSVADSPARTVRYSSESTAVVASSGAMDQPSGVLAAIAELTRTTQMVLTQQAAAQQSFQELLIQRLAPGQAAPIPTSQAQATSPDRTAGHHRGETSVLTSGSDGDRGRQRRRDRSLSPPPRSHRSDRRSRSRPRNDSHHRDRSWSRGRDHVGRVGSNRQTHRSPRNGGRSPGTPRADRVGAWDTRFLRDNRADARPERHDRYGDVSSPFPGYTSRNREVEEPYSEGLRRPRSGTQFSDFRSPLRAAHEPSSFPLRDYEALFRRGHTSGDELRLVDYTRNMETPMELTGTAGFRPSPAELRVHQIARVGPRPRGEFIESNLVSFWQMSALDRVSAILHQEALRGRAYRVTKVTAKMIFSVDFGTRPLDHFLPRPALGDGSRTVVHDSSTWASGDTTPEGYITAIGDLRQTLRCIRGVAVEWYPEPVADVFSAVYTDASNELLDEAPTRLVHAMVNLYTHVFTRLFSSISQNYEARRLVGQAHAIMAPDSTDYFRIVRQVIDRGLFSTWAQAEGPRTTHTTTRLTGNRSRSGPQRGGANQRRRQTGPIPDNILRQIPLQDRKSICLRFQSQGGCDYRSCKYPHVHMQLPEDVATFVIEKHGPLATGHPNLPA